MATTTKSRPRRKAPKARRAGATRAGRKTRVKGAVRGGRTLGLPERIRARLLARYSRQFTLAACRLAAKVWGDVKPPMDDQFTPAAKTQVQDIYVLTLGRYVCEGLDDHGKDVMENDDFGKWIADQIATIVDKARKAAGPNKITAAQFKATAKKHMMDQHPPCAKMWKPAAQRRGVGDVCGPFLDQNNP